MGFPNHSIYCHAIDYSWLVRLIGNAAEWEERTIKPTWMPVTAFRSIEGKIVVKLLHTHIMRYWPSGEIELFADGWETNTTKVRMNTFLGRNWQIYQKDHLWRVKDLRHGWTGGKEYMFRDGIVLLPDGGVHQPWLHGEYFLGVNVHGQMQLAF